jgi:hypothetical protein
MPQPRRSNHRHETSKLAVERWMVEAAQPHKVVRAKALQLR